MNLNMWNNQKINIDWKLCFIRQQQGKEKHHKELSHYHQICQSYGGWEFLISHVQVSLLLYMMKQNWKII